MHNLYLTLAIKICLWEFSLVSKAIYCFNRIGGAKIPLEHGSSEKNQKRLRNLMCFFKVCSHCDLFISTVLFLIFILDSP